MDLNSSYVELGAALVTGILGPIVVQHLKNKYYTVPPVDPLLS